jgi:SAM-dependent methyltransferase
MSHHLGLAGLLPGEHVLELGCGSGADVSAAAEQVGPGGSVTGIDITLEELAEAERLCPDENVSFRWGSPHELPFADGSFDAVISNGVVHLWNDKPRVRGGRARSPPGRTPRAHRHHRRAPGRRPQRLRGVPLGRLRRGCQRDRPLPRPDHDSRPRAAAGPGQPRLPLPEPPGAAPKPKVRRPRHRAGRREAPTQRRGTDSRPPQPASRRLGGLAAAG